MILSVQVGSALTDGCLIPAILSSGPPTLITRSSLEWGRIEYGGLFKERNGECSSCRMIERSNQKIPNFHAMISEVVVDGFVRKFWLVKEAVVFCGCHFGALWQSNA